MEQTEEWNKLFYIILCTPYINKYKYYLGVFFGSSKTATPTIRNTFEARENAVLPYIFSTIFNYLLT